MNADYAKWLKTKGLTSNAGTGAQWRMKQGMDLTTAQTQKLGLKAPTGTGQDTMVDGVQTGTEGSSKADAMKAAQRYAAKVGKKASSPVSGLSGVKKPAKPGWDAMKKAVGGKPSGPDVSPDPTGVAAGVAAAASTGEKKDPGFSKPGQPWKPGPGNQSKKMHDAAQQFNWKMKGKK